MAADDGYEGWTNRETWCAQLWLSNDQGTYMMVREWTTDAWKEALDETLVGEGAITLEGTTSSAAWKLADQLKDWFEELENGEGEDDYVPTPAVYKMLSDIGSLYRVDWHEIAEHWVREAREESGR